MTIPKIVFPQYIYVNVYPTKKYKAYQNEGRFFHFLIDVS